MKTIEISTPQEFSEALKQFGLTHSPLPALPLSITINGKETVEFICTHPDEYIDEHGDTRCTLCDELLLPDELFVF